MNRARRKVVSLSMALLILTGNLISIHGQSQTQPPPYQSYQETDYESVRSDKFTGGRIERATLQAGQTDIEISINVPAFQLTLWQNGKEIRNYPVGVGLKDYPIAIGERDAREIIWNPSWIPPDSEWVYEMKGIKPGEEIKAGDPRNPLGRLKIPLGGGYLIHEAKGISDLGNLVSHGCVRMLRSHLYDLAEKISEAYSWPVTKSQIERAKRGNTVLVANLDPVIPVTIDYDTEVIEEGVLHLYPDVYGRGTNTIERLRMELEEHDIDATKISDRTLTRMLARVSRDQEFSVSVESIKAGRALTDGRTRPLIGNLSIKDTNVRRQAASR